MVPVTINYSAYAGDYDDAWDDYMVYGGLPQVVGFQIERQKADYLKNMIVNTPGKVLVQFSCSQNLWVSGEKLMHYLIEQARTGHIR